MTDPLVQDYLRRLDAAAQPLAPDRRAELLAGIREHIDAAIASGEVGDEASTRALLDRLGEPEEIVAAARDEDPDPTTGALWSPPAAAPVRYRRQGIGLEIAAALMLTVGSVFFVVGWLVGVVLLWVSRRWTVGEKLVATLVFPGGPAIVLWLSVVAVGGQSCTSGASVASDGTGDSVTTATTCESTGALPLTVGLVALIAWVVMPVVVAGVLLSRARRRADAEPPVPVDPASPSPWGGLEIAAVLLLGVGGFLAPVIAPVAGLVCAWMSDQWTRNEKWVATAIASLGLMIPVVALLSLVAVRSS